MSGFIYVIQWSSELEYFKIGKTGDNVIQLHKRYKTYYPEMNIICFNHVNNSGWCEKECHRMLNKYCVNNSEVFKTSFETIKIVLRDVLKADSETKESVALPVESPIPTNIPITNFMEQQIEIAKDEGDNVDKFLADHLQSLLTDNKLLNLKFTMNEPLHCLAEWHEFKTKFETALYTVSGSKGDFDISVLRENLVYHKPSDKMTITDVLLKTICEKITKKKLDQKGHNSLVARMSRINLFESNNIKLKEKNVKRWYLK